MREVAVMRSKPRAILFDLDDTLISFDGVSRQAWERCCTAFLETHAIGLQQADLLREIYKAGTWFWSDPQRHKTGRENLREARRGVAKIALGALGVESGALAGELADRYTALHHSLVHPYPGTLPTLTALREAGYRLGLVTNGTSAGQRDKLRRFGFAPFFEIILIDQELGFGKPDVRVYGHAAGLLRLSYASLWMVGDNLVWDIQSPQSLGIYTVWHDYRQAGLPADAAAAPDAVIHRIDELPALLP